MNLKLMREIDEIYTEMPYYGRRKITAQLRRQGYEVNPKRVRRLMAKMGLEAIYPRPKAKTASQAQAHQIFPYLLRNRVIERPNQVWSTDITYIPMQQGFMYLTAIIDWFSRYIITWELSNSLDGHFCQAALQLSLIHI